jgi:uncharacterized membrane protein YbjE (DUF340 family)
LVIKIGGQLAPRGENLWGAKIQKEEVQARMSYIAGVTAGLLLGKALQLFHKDPTTCVVLVLGVVGIEILFYGWLKLKEEVRRYKL